jgi:hypothetical protein
MARKACVELTHVKALQKYTGPCSCLTGNTVDDTVYAGKNDYIYFYNIDSCMAAAFFPINSKDPVVGIHLSSEATNEQWKKDDSMSCAEYYLQKLQHESIGKFGRAAFVGYVGDWGGAAAKLVKELKIYNAVFLEVYDPMDAWAFPGVDSKVAWLKHKRVTWRYDPPSLKDCNVQKMSEVTGVSGPGTFRNVYKSLLEKNL